jgi:hypothetical protein
MQKLKKKCATFKQREKKSLDKAFLQIVSILGGNKLCCSIQLHFISLVTGRVALLHHLRVHQGK